MRVIGLVVAVLVAAVALDATAAWRRAVHVRSLLHPGMAGPEVIRAAAPFASEVLPEPACLADKGGATCPEVTLLFRGPLLAVTACVVRLGSDRRVRDVGPVSFY